jgi:hypothetical protein
LRSALLVSRILLGFCISGRAGLAIARLLASLNPNTGFGRQSRNFVSSIAFSFGLYRWRPHMGRGLLLWLLGIPIPIILLIWLFGGLH